MEKNLKLLAFDADDTLWDCQSQFNEIENLYAGILSPFGTIDEVAASLFKRETANMPLLGYGCKAFTISLVENAITISHGNISAFDILKIVSLGKSLLTLSASPLPEVKETLETIRAQEKYNMVVFTKGELLDQENKLKRSGLKKYFDDAIIVSDKSENEYQKLCKRFNVDISELIMVGNSFKSDIEPVLKLGGKAVHIPYHTIWKHEVTTEYNHQNLFKISNFKELIKILD